MVLDVLEHLRESERRYREEGKTRLADCALRNQARSGNLVERPSNPGPAKGRCYQQAERARGALLTEHEERLIRPRAHGSAGVDYRVRDSGGRDGSALRQKVGQERDQGGRSLSVSCHGQGVSSAGDGEGLFEFRNFPGLTATGVRRCAGQRRTGF
eukprot:3242735-Rhodomonas_salina.1